MGICHYIFLYALTFRKWPNKNFPIPGIEYIFVHISIDENKLKGEVYARGSAISFV